MSPALKIALILSVLGVCGLLAFYAAIAAWMVNTVQGTRARIERIQSEGTIEMPPLGPNPWKPKEKLSGKAGLYEIESLGLLIEFPAPPVWDASKYSAEDAARMEATCYYLSSDQNQDYIFYGLKMKASEPKGLDYAAEVFEWMFRDDPTYDKLRLRRQNVTWGGKLAIRLSGSFPYLGSRLFVEGIVTYHEGVQFGLLIQEYERANAERILRRIVDSTKFSSLRRPTSAAAESRRGP